MSKERADKRAKKLQHSFSDKPLQKLAPSPHVVQISNSPETPTPEVIDLNALRAKQVKEWEDMRTYLDEQYAGDADFNNDWGKLVFGETKVVNGKEVPWTREDAIEHASEAGDREESESRRKLTRDLTFAFNMQSKHFGNPEDPQADETSEVIDACATILGTVLRSDEKLTDMWDIRRAEARTQSQLLEVVRRITLKPPYFMFGMEHDGDLDAFSFPGDDYGHRFQAFDDYDKFLEVNDLDRSPIAEQAYMLNNVQNYSDREWDRILLLQEAMVFTYVKNLAKKFSNVSEVVSGMAPRMIDYGEAVYTEEELQMFRQKAENAKEVAAVVGSMEEFTDLFPQIKQWFGEDAGFKELLSKLAPVKLSINGSFKVPESNFFKNTDF